MKAMAILRSGDIACRVFINLRMIYNIYVLLESHQLKHIAPFPGPHTSTQKREHAGICH